MTTTPLSHWLDIHARHRPQAPALASPRRAWTYGELAAATELNADRLAAQLTDETRIVALAAGATDLALAAYAGAAAGVGFFPLAPAGTDHHWPLFQSLGGGALQRLDAAALFGAPGAPHPTPRPARRAALPEQPALIIATSGSEGLPKGVMLSQANLAASAAASAATLPLAPGDAWLACLPLHHIGGFSILVRCAAAGALAVMHEDFDPAAVARAFATDGITHVSLVPAMLSQLLDAEVAPPSTLRAALIGGAALSRPLFERAIDAGWPLCPTYGMSETASQAATLPWPRRDEWHEGLVGAPLPGVEAAIGADGRIRLRGPQLMLGYLNPALAPGLGLEDGGFLSADLGRIDADGRLTVLGRADDLLVSGGVNVHPQEVESRLAACPGVADVAVTARPDPVWGDLLVALVVGADAETVLAWSREHLASPQRPRRVLRVDRLPRNAVGKLERSALRRLAEEGC